LEIVGVPGCSRVVVKQPPRDHVVCEDNKSEAAADARIGARLCVRKRGELLGHAFCEPAPPGHWCQLLSCFWPVGMSSCPAEL
jgi:hypothetical protein